LLKKLMAWFAANPTASFERATILPDNDNGTTTGHKEAKRAG